MHDFLLVLSVLYAYGIGLFMIIIASIGTVELLTKNKNII